MGASDEEILRLLREVEAQENVVDEVKAEAEAPLVEGETCAYCGEVAEAFGSCHVCHETGCLPPELWSPGMGEPCLTLCVRCARTIHVSCAMEDQAGNPRCPTCHY